MVDFVVIPNFCPNCGAVLYNTQGCIDTHGEMAEKFMPIDSSFQFEYEWDCYCIECGWSGEIKPDVNRCKK